MAVFEKIELLNRLLAIGSPSAKNYYVEAARGMELALDDAEQLNTAVNVSNFAKVAMSFYDPSAKVEVVEFSGGHFDSLFVFSSIREAVKRLSSGGGRAVLVIYGLDCTMRASSGRRTRKRFAQYGENLSLVENWAQRYNGSFPNLEIMFV